LQYGYIVKINTYGITIMKQQAITLLSTLLITFAPAGQAASSGGSGGSVVVPTPDSYVSVSGYVQPGEWQLSAGFDKRSLPNVNGSVASGNASVSATADAQQGVLGVFADASNHPAYSQSAVSSAEATFRDKLKVEKSGVSTKAVLHAKLTGNITRGQGDGASDYATFDLGVTNDIGLQLTSGLFTANPVSSCDPIFSGFTKVCIADEKPTYQTKIEFDLPAEGGTFQIFGILSTQASDGAIIDFRNGFHVWLELPVNTILNSPTGFPVSQVPEPSLLSLVLLGLAGILIRKNSYREVA
jgi:hypothetical protein